MQFDRFDGRRASAVGFAVSVMLGFVFGLGLVRAAHAQDLETAVIDTPTGRIINLGATGADVATAPQVSVEPSMREGVAFETVGAQLAVTFPRDHLGALTATAPGLPPLAFCAAAMRAVSEAGDVLREELPMPVAPAQDGNSVTYAGSYTATDDVFVAMPHRLKHDIVLHAGPVLPSGTAAWRACYWLVLPPGHDLAPGRYTTIDIADANGDVAYTLPAIEAIDARGDHATGEYIVSIEFGRVLLAIEMQATWLTSAAYPVRVDPIVDIPLTGINNNIPFSGSFIPCRFMTFYTASQMQSTAGLITAVGMQWGAITNNSWSNVEIYLGETTFTATTFDLTTFDNNYNAVAAQLCYSGTLSVTTTTPAEFFRVTLQTPFLYSGVNNLVVEYRVPVAGTGTGTSCATQSQSPAINARVYAVGSTTATTSTGSLVGRGNGASFDITTAAAPVVTGVAPNPVDWLQTLTITGTNLDSATGVTIGGTAATVTANTSTQIDVTVSATTPTGSQTVAVTTAGGTDNSQTVTVNGIAPSITTATPDPVNWLATLTITGTALANATSVTIGGTAATITSNTGSQIDVTVADGTPTGSQAVVVTTALGSDTTNVTVNSVAPGVTGVSPNPVLWLGTLTINGAALSTVTSVTIGGVAATVTTTTSTQLQVTVDISTPTGTLTVAVTTAGGLDNSQSVQVDGIAPTVASVTPNPVFSNGTLTIDGNALANATAVTVGAVAATITSNTMTQITITLGGATPIGAGQNVVVTTAWGSDSTQTVEVQTPPLAGSGGGSGCCSAGSRHDVSAAWLVAMFALLLTAALRRRLA